MNKDKITKIIAATLLLFLLGGCVSVIVNHEINKSVLKEVTVPKYSTSDAAMAKVKDIENDYNVLYKTHWYKYCEDNSTLGLLKAAKALKVKAQEYNKLYPEIEDYHTLMNNTLVLCNQIIDYVNNPTFTNYSLNGRAKSYYKSQPQFGLLERQLYNMQFVLYEKKMQEDNN